MGKSFGNMSGKSISLGLGARNLRDQDFFGVSDPYVVISRPNPSGGFTKIRTSETKKNTLNPNWNDFLFTEAELNGYDRDLKLMIQVYDDDGKKGPDGKDQLIGSGFFSLKELEAGSIVNTNLPLTDGKRSKSPGFLVVRSYKEHLVAGGYPSGGQGGYPGSAPPMGQGGYNQNFPPNYAGAPGPAQGYPVGSQYGAPPTGYPPQQGGGYPPQQPDGYPPQQAGGYGGPQGTYPGGDPMYPPN